LANNLDILRLWARVRFALRRRWKARKRPSADLYRRFAERTARLRRAFRTRTLLAYHRTSRKRRFKPFLPRGSLAIFARYLVFNTRRLARYCLKATLRCP